MHKVDIIIPVYKVEPFLRRCLDSILAQTFSDWRAICVDDGSPDGCPAILDSYAAKDSRFLVIHKENGGLSDARNVGLDIADAEFYMFIDSDDFIHPQTLEIGVHLAEKHKSDIVTWYRDSLYRNQQVKLCRLLHKDPIASVPWRYGKRYNPDKIRCHSSDNLIGHCSDWNHPHISWAIKHNHVFKFLLRRSTTGDLRFIKGMTFEDINWWSEMMLKSLRVTITHLPLYYYYPNTSSIMKGSRAASVQQNVLRAIHITYLTYREKATPYQMRHWSRHIKWAILRGMSKQFGKLNDASSREQVRLTYRQMLDEGVFDDARTLSNRRAYVRICRFVGAKDNLQTVSPLIRALT